MRFRNRKPYLIFGATVSWLAVVIQYFLMIENTEVSIVEATVRFFSYFTILTNALVALYFTLQLNTDPKIKHQVEKPGVMTAVAVYISIVGLVYQFVLRYTWDPEGLQMIIDELLHSVIPLYFVLFWFLFEEKLLVKWSQTPLILIYPTLYIGYILVRGKWSGFYPYPFVNVAVLGMDQVLMNSIVMLCLFILLIFIFVGVGKIVERAEQ